jgi:PAT family beta-lactamase induction signal transducer AmpG
MPLKFWTRSSRAGLPIWMLGMTNILFGMYGGILVIAVPALLSARHVPQSTINTLTAAAISPGAWAFFASPVLDVRFSRRWYSVVTALIAAVLMTIAFLNIGNVFLFGVLLVVSFFFANLYQSALGGWLSSIIKTEEENQLSVWVTIANISGGGAMAVVAGELVQALPLGVAAPVLGVIVLLPLAIFPWMESPSADRRLASESFGRFFAEVLAVLKRRDVLVAIALFVAPAATFSLVNHLAGLGEDFQASTEFVDRIGGVGVVIAGLAGCLLFPLVDRLLPLRYLYLTVGVIGSGFTLLLLMLPRTPTTFALALIGENVFQSLSITVSTAISFDTVGRKNPLAATTYCLMISSFNIANTYMLIVDGWGHAWRGVTGSYLIDAAVSLSASALLAMMLLTLSRRQRARGVLAQSTTSP